MTYEAARMDRLERMAKFAESHGHKVKIGLDHIMVGIECVKDGVMVGLEWDQADTWSELREILGY